MDEFIKSIQAVIPFLTPYPLWVKIIVSIWVVLSAFLLLSLLFVPHITAHDQSATPIEKGAGQAKSVTSSVSSVNQAGGVTAGIINGNVIINSPALSHPNKETQSQGAAQAITKDKSPDNPTNESWPIKWVWDENSPLATIRGYGEPLLIIGFQIKGTNISKDPLTSIKAFIRSDITADTYELKISDSESSQLISTNNVIIPPDVNFTLIHVFQHHDRGIIADRFRIDFRQFTLIFEHDGKKIIKHFSSKDVDDFIDRADRATRDALKPPSDQIIIKK